MISITLVNIDGTTNVISDILSFNFVKDCYTPYTSLSAAFLSDGISPENVREIKLCINSKLVHHGIADTLDVCTQNGTTVCKITSRGFTSLLTQNQLEPGLKPNISFNSLMESFCTIPHVLHENNSDTSNYIYVKPNSDMWDGIANLSYKLYGTYPYIRDANTVRITPVSTPESFSYDNAELLKSGTRRTTKHMISDYHMTNIDGDYGDFDLTDQNVRALDIVRNFYFELDLQYLSSPMNALYFRDKFNTRKAISHYCLYSGYNSEDISDVVSFGSVEEKRINAVRIFGSSKGIFTELSVFSDSFYQ